MAMTVKQRKDGKAKAVFAVYFGLTEEDVAVIKRLADREGNVSSRQLVKRIAVKAVEDVIAANR